MADHLWLGWYLRKIDRIAATKKRYKPDQAPPQRNCPSREAHDRHTWTAESGLVWTCQGRGAKIESKPK